MHVRRLMLASCVSLSVGLIVVFAFACTALATLPDNRAYEMVSPIEKGGDSRVANLAVTSPNGEHVVVDGGVDSSLLSSGASWMLENRGPTGWTGVQVGPPPGQGSANENYIEQRSTELAAVSEDFSSFAFQTLIGINPGDHDSSPGVQSSVYGIETAEDVPSSDVYVRNGPTGPFTWASAPPSMEKTTQLPAECETEPVYCGENNAVFAGGSSDLSVMVWSQRSPLVAPPGSLAGSSSDTHQHGSEVYESTDGADQQLVGMVPASGSECGPRSCVVPPCGAAMGNTSGHTDVLGNSFAPTQGDVSGDGSQIVFTSPEPAVEGEEGCPTSEIYVRENGTTTVQVSASQRTGGDPHGPRRKDYVGAAEEGGKIDTVFFTSSEELTNDANTGSEDQGNDLYAYSMARGKLTDITTDSNSADEDGSDVISFIGSSTDGSIVYFTAPGVLTTEPNSQGATAQSGATNLYVYDAETGTTKFIAPGGGVHGPTAVKERGFTEVRQITSDVTPDGGHLVFATNEHVTSYNNVVSSCGGPCTEIYLYDQTASQVTCVSCDLSGAPPSGSASLPQEFEEGFFTYFEAPDTLPRPRVASDNGERVFFNSPDQLTPETPAPGPTSAKYIITEENLEPNVFEYEHGHIYLIAPDASLSTTTPSGNDAFFDTLDQLVPQDKDGSPDIYDARVDGGFPALAAPECSGTSCQGTPAPAPIFAAPPSTTFSGVGNFPAPVSSPVSAKKTKSVKKAKKKTVRAKVKRKASKRARRSRTHSRRGSRR